MNLRERRWRHDVKEAVHKLDHRIAGGTLEFQELHAMIDLRERLAGALGAEEGWTSTPQLRERAQTDYALAMKALEVRNADELEVPQGDPATDVYEKDFASFRRAPPKRGDRT